ncbi:MAG: hypothetical protein ABIJ14_00230 [Nanoarchaeota archaeon]
MGFGLLADARLLLAPKSTLSDFSAKEVIIYLATYLSEKLDEVSFEPINLRTCEQ